MLKTGYSPPCMLLVPQLFALVFSLPVAAGAQRSPADSAAILVQAGLHAYQQGSRESLQLSIQLFQQALPQLRNANDRYREGTTLNNIGLAFQALGRADSALVYFPLALAILREVGDRRGEGVTLSNIGQASQAVGRVDSALVYYLRALPIARELMDRRGEGARLHNIGSAYQALGRTDSAFAYYAQALVLRRAIRDRRGEGATLINLGSLHYDLGRADSALVYLVPALAIIREVADRRAEGVTLSHIGSAHLKLGRADTALVYDVMALAILREVGDRRAEAATLNDIGTVYDALSRSDSALLYYKQALTIGHEIGDRAGASVTLSNIGSVYYVLGRLDSARVYYARALAIMREIGDRRREAHALNNIGSIYQALGHADSALVYHVSALAVQTQIRDLGGKGVTLHNIGLAHQTSGRADSALVYYVRALAILREVGDRKSEGTTLSNMGLANQTLNRSDSALNYYARALTVAREVGDRSGEGITLGNIGSVYRRLDSSRDLARAVEYFDSAAAVVGDIRRSSGNDPDRLSFAEQDIGLFHEWTLAWLARTPELPKRSTASAALATSERGRAQALRDLMRRNAIESSGAEPAHARAGADLPAEGRALASAVVRSGIPALYYLVTSDTLLTFVLLPGEEPEVFRTAVSRYTLAALVAALRTGLAIDSADSRTRTRPSRVSRLNAGPSLMRSRELEASNAWQDPAIRLSSLLLSPEIRARLPASGELVIVPDGPLFLLPFAVLPLPQVAAQMVDSTSIFGRRYAIRYAPSLQVLAGLESQPGPSRPPGEALVVGNPTMPRIPDEEGGFFVPSPLEGAEAEGRWVAERLGTRLLTGDEATEATVRARLGNASLVHLATHGYAYSSDARARDTYIALAPGVGQDGLLTVGELLDDVGEMRAELVVLSACQTGLGNLKQAEGTVGLQRAFMARGARGVLVSLWSVKDDAAALLMQRFYSHWLGGDTKAEALRKAQAEVAADPRFVHPRYWAAYQLVGAR